MTMTNAETIAESLAKYYAIEKVAQKLFLKERNVARNKKTNVVVDAWIAHCDLLRELGEM